MKQNLSYVEVLVEILDWKVERFMNKEVAFVKGLWRNHLVEGSTWKVEANIMSQYPYLHSLILD